MLLAWGFLMSFFTGSAIWLTNKLQKWAEIYGLKMCLRNVRHQSGTCRFWYHIRVLFIVLARYADVLSWTDIRKSKMASKTGNGKPSVRNNIFEKFQRLYLHFRGRPHIFGVLDSKDLCPTADTNR